jgi:hypothetical protein
MAVPMPTIANPPDAIFRLFRGNHEQLIQFLEYVEAPLRLVELWSPLSNHQVYLIDEATRLIFNFAVSAVTFVDLTEKLFNKLPKIKELEQLTKEYQQEKKQRFDTNSNYKIVDGLRQYLIHSDTIGIGRVYHYNREKGEKHTLVIAKDKLITGYGFSRIARSQLMREKGDINIRLLTEQCFNNLQEFDQWLWDKQAMIMNDRNFYLEIE